MEIIKATLWIYKTAMVRSTQLIAGNWVVSFAPLAYGILLSLASLFFAPLGLVGGILFALATHACASSGLFLIENILKAGRSDFNDFLWGFTVYIWELVRISFILWIPLMLASAALARLPNGGLMLLFIQIVLYILLNAVPELIYQTRTVGIELLSASYEFVIENWIEWFTPNIAITAAGYVLLQYLGLLARWFPGPLQVFVVAFGFGLCVTYFMLFRGILFSELNGSTRRNRVYRYKMRDSV